MNEEYILCSAIHYDNGVHYSWCDKYGIETGYVLCGYRHDDIIRLIPTNPKYVVEDNHPLMENIVENNLKTTQGFMTNKSRFVNREDGASIAFKSGQIDQEKKMLFSEDLY